LVKQEEAKQLSINGLITWSPSRVENLDSFVVDYEQMCWIKY